MSDVLERYRKECEEMQLAAMIWWLIIWYASDEGNPEVPSEQEWLSCELVATIAEEMTGEKFQYSWRHDEFGRERHQQWDVWPEYLNRVMERFPQYPQYHPGATASKCKALDLLKRFVKYQFAFERDEKWYASELRTFHRGNTPTTFGCSRFVPHREMHNRALWYLTEHMAELGFDRIELVTDWLSRIGMQIMRPYVERDIAYIKKHYSW